MNILRVLKGVNTAIAVGGTVVTVYQTMNKVFKYIDCPFCGAEQNGAVASLSDFLGG